MFAKSSQAGSACATTATILMYTILNGKGGLTDGGLTDGGLTNGGLTNGGLTSCGLQGF